MMLKMRDKGNLLKSDRFGMEITDKTTIWFNTLKLKSDRFGMEISFSRVGRFLIIKYVKIRPFRYGNLIEEKTITQTIQC